jgi:uncharacterized protein HemX
MRQEYWAAVAVAALLIGLLIGYGIWGGRAGRLAELERERDALAAQVKEVKQKADQLEANIGKIVNEKLNLEKENAALKEALEAAKKKR